MVMLRWWFGRRGGGGHQEWEVVVERWVAVLGSSGAGGRWVIGSRILFVSPLIVRTVPFQCGGKVRTAFRVTVQ